MPAALPRRSSMRREYLCGLASAFAAAMAPRYVRAECSKRETLGLSSRSGNTLRVGAGGTYSTIASAVAAARSGDTVEVLPGEYRGDVAVLSRDDVVIRGIGQRPVLVADGRDAEGKGIFVSRGRGIVISNLDFRGARVRDRNGAGIRVERGPIKIVGCHFEGNENGILVGNDTTIDVEILDSAFVGNGAGDGYSHNLYVGTVARLNVTGCYFARARVGHLLKSRARESTISYCRLTGEDGTASYELEFPNGGRVLAIGNLIQQGPLSENPTLVSYGAEGYRQAGNELVFAFNTVVNDRTQGGIFVNVRPGVDQVDLLNNLFVGPGSMAIDFPHAARGNLSVNADIFAAAHKLDYRLRSTARVVGGAVGGAADKGPRPSREYSHIASTCELQPSIPLRPLSPGAFQTLAS